MFLFISKAVSAFADKSHSVDLRILRGYLLTIIFKQRSRPLNSYWPFN